LFNTFSEGSRQASGAGCSLEKGREVLLDEVLFGDLGDFLIKGVVLSLQNSDFLVSHALSFVLEHSAEGEVIRDGLPGGDLDVKSFVSVRGDVEGLH